MYVMVHRNCLMETKGFQNRDFPNFIQQHSYNHDKYNRKEGDGDRMSPERETHRNHIEHRVSKMDTLAGIAIKYGVEVADIKRMNGLVTDLQMFALKTLQIPPGRHPPSPGLANGLDDAQGSSGLKQTPPPRRHSDLFDSFQALKPKSRTQRISPAMSTLQGYYGLKQVNQKILSEGFEMAVSEKGTSNYSKKDDHLTESLPLSNHPLSLERKSKSIANNLSSRNGSEKQNEKLIIRPRKYESHCKMMEDNTSNSIGFSKITGKGLALRSNRTSSGVDPELEKLNPIPINMPDNIVQESSLSGVKKSSSTSSLQDQQNSVSSASSIWPDLQALSAAVMTRPLFDGLPKPITGWKNKAALD